MSILTHYSLFSKLWTLVKGDTTIVVTDEVFHRCDIKWEWKEVNIGSMTGEIVSEQIDNIFEFFLEHALIHSVHTGVNKADQPIEVKSEMSYTPLIPTHYTWYVDRKGRKRVKTLAYLQSFDEERRRRVIAVHIQQGVYLKKCPEGIQTKQQLQEYLDG